VNENISNWAKQEVERMNFKDKRLEKRCAILLEALGKKSEASIPRACQSKAATKAAYRFFDNNRIATDEIRKGFFDATANRIKEHKVVLILSDSTNIVYSSHKSLKGIGVLRNFKAKGLNKHSALVVTPDEQPLGLLYQKIWGRTPESYGKRFLRSKLPIEQKESFCWLESLSQASKKIPPETRGVFIGDRGADIYELFLEKRAPNIDLLVRSSFNRRLKNTSKNLFETLLDLPVAGTMNVDVGRGPNTPKRLAKCSIAFSQIELNNKSNTLNTAVLSVIHIKEKNIQNVTNPIEWRLFTTISITSLDEATQCVRWYASRWIIERYHFTLKSGCKIQDLQLEEAYRIERAIILYSIIAWRIMFITYASRTDPTSLCSKILNTSEWQALHCFINKSKHLPKTPPTTKETVYMLAKLGGFLGRKSDKDPGLKVIWIGLSRLNDITEAYEIFREKRCG